MRKKKSKGKVIAIVILAVLAVAGGGAFAFLHHHQTTDVFLPNTYYLGEDVSGQTKEHILEKVTSAVGAVSVTLNEQGEPALTGNLADFGFLLDENAARESLVRAMSEQKASLVTVFKCLTGEKTRVTADVAWDFDEKTFAQKVTAANLPTPRVASRDAELVQNNEARKLELVEEIYGNEFKEDQLQDWVQQQIEGNLAENGLTDIEMDFPDAFYIKPTVTKDDPSIQQKMQALAPFEGAEVDYLFGTQKEVLDYATIISWVDISGNTGTLNQEKMSAFVKDLVARYNTRYRVRKFTTSKGKEIEIPENLNEYGYRINESAELEQLAADLTSGQVVEREPVYYRTNQWDNPLYYGREGRDDLAGNYIEVSIDDQHLWFYKDGKLFLESDVVTGDITKDAGTATGAYPLAYKMRDYTLTGGEGNGAYATPVDYWMPFYEGQGLHDASWRSNFGGSIYKGNGSHGCVNLPKKIAKKIFENVNAGIAIIIY